MINIVLGNLGSGKTACVVNNMLHSRIPVYTNIKTRNMKHVHMIKPEMIITQKIVSVSKTGIEKSKPVFNKNFWLDIIEKKGSINIVLDEFHLMMDARRSTSTINKILADFLAMGRRISQANIDNGGSITLISQLERRIDIISKELATNIQWTKSHKLRSCKCGFTIWQTNEDPIQHFSCPKCNRNMNVDKVIIEFWLFNNYESFQLFNMYNRKTYYYHGYINNIEKIFPLYNTLQWEDMFDGYY